MEYVSLIKDLGIPIAMLVAIGIGSWRSASWFGQKVILPLQERHMAFLTNLEKALSQIADGQNRMVLELDRLSRLGCGQGHTKPETTSRK